MVLNLIGNFIADKVTDLLVSACLKLLKITVKFICKGCSKFITCICCCRTRKGQSFDDNRNQLTQLHFHCVFCGSNYHSADQCNSFVALQARQATHKLVYPDIQPPLPPPSSSSSAAQSSTAPAVKANTSKAPSLLAKGLDTSRIVKKR